MGLIQAEIELVSAEDVVIVPKLQTIDVNPKSKYLTKKKLNSYLNLTLL